MIDIKRSLCDILSSGYCNTVNEVSSFSMGLNPVESRKAANEKVSFINDDFLNKQKNYSI